MVLPYALPRASGIYQVKAARISSVQPRSRRFHPLPWWLSRLSLWTDLACKTAAPWIWGLLLYALLCIFRCHKIRSLSCLLWPIWRLYSCYALIPAKYGHRSQCNILRWWRLTNLWKAGDKMNCSGGKFCCTGATIYLVVICGSISYAIKAIRFGCSQVIKPVNCIHLPPFASIDRKNKDLYEYG